ncbi:hypothetical protein N7499_006642 [Penicillium canescens]|uniref:Zn(2)-C6 fungal-type domain-containing protein n=1 Tax=Penicillium canescens TaxID=5083 RepID=A0AAD6N9Q8_PENCN|nr:hypothetical protein N7522_008701 [Penicillium canescens]KAJ6044139.1 hypothetical protein N7460_005494 [Penicillium canescens]KAJ6055609.1 hypothetical protein N7444_004707 [Penicillium canescens]KAJ6081768.1 hypothetical protein N7499_006642 [Penicillium canescens]KAJ6176431.1 hypothetical protein N7485_003345 [Penicillium canescens]
MDTFNELPITENSTSEASFSEASPSDATVEDISIHDVPTNVPTINVFTSNSPTSDVPSSDTPMNESFANETAITPSENITPKKKKTRRGRNDPEPDWSAQMRDKVKKSNSRIGQACDRCKAKKMRCTPDHTGCASCISQNLSCKVTDRVTGETYVRGEAGRMRLVIERLNDQADNLKREVMRLQQENELLRDSHVELKSRINMYKSSLDTYEAGFVLNNPEADLMHLL